LDVRRHDGADVTEAGLLAHDGLRSRRVGLLARLVEGEKGLAERPLRAAGGAEEGREGRHVEVVAAGVHEAVIGGERRPGLFEYGEGVQLRAHGDGTPASLPRAGEEAGTGHGLDVGGFEGLGHEAGRAVLRVARLRARVQALA
jgi:hypothetical protein